MAVIGQTKSKILNLQYHFNEDEITELGKKLALKQVELKQDQAEFGNIKKEWTAKINSNEVDIDRIATSINDGFEYRNVDCDVTMNDPYNGKKTIYRRDTHESWVEEMTNFDMELF